VTVTYDPDHPRYFDEGDLRSELNRVYDLCHGCRLCVSLCPAFPTLFDLIDANDGNVEALTAADQDRVVDECYQCKLCYVKCPYVPPHEWQLDFPRLMLRAEAVANRQSKDIKGKLATQVLGRTDWLGKAATSAPALANAVLGARGGPVRKAREAVAGVAAERLLPPYAKTRFSTWFKRRTSRLERPEQARAAVFATCLVEYSNPAVGQDLVKVYERNGVAVSLPQGVGCCGAPWLHSGEFGQFKREAARNVESLAREVKAGRDIVVPQPTCGYVLKRDYPEYLKSEDARLVGAHTYDASEYLWRLYKGNDTTLDTGFGGAVPRSVAYHVPCHLQAQNIGLRSRDLLKLTGAKVKVVQKCSGIDGMWGFRQENYRLSRQVSAPLADAVSKSDAEVVAGDCHLANGAITEETGRQPLHPLQVLARAYGIEEEKG
jgi:glycerol-3-phosphate dehydrogenase subunit C